MNYDIWKIESEKLMSLLDIKDMALKACIEKLLKEQGKVSESGLLPDSIAENQEYKEVKSEYRSAFHDLREFNKNSPKNFFNKRNKEDRKKRLSVFNSNPEQYCYIFKISGYSNIFKTKMNSYESAEEAGEKISAAILPENLDFRHIESSVDPWKQETLDSAQEIDTVILSDDESQAMIKLNESRCFFYSKESTGQYLKELNFDDFSDSEISAYIAPYYTDIDSLKEMRGDDWKMIALDCVFQKKQEEIKLESDNFDEQLVADFVENSNTSLKIKTLK